MQKIFFSIFLMLIAECFSIAKMVETKQDWEQEAKNIPLEQRKLEDYKEPQSTKKIYYPKEKYVFEKYNSYPGKRELNIEDIKKNLRVYPYVVADINCKYVAYPRYYYSPDVNQVVSEFFVGKLDTRKIRVKRILDYHHNQKTRTPIIEAGKTEVYQNLFRGLTLVDWSADSKKLLIKEKVGSMQKGIYKTNLYLYIAKDDIEEGYTYKLDIVDKAVKEHFLDAKNLQIIKYRYDIEPLGFSADNDDVIIVLAYAYDKNNNKVFLGAWGYNCEEKEVVLLSDSRTDFSISANGMFIKRSID